MLGHPSEPWELPALNIRSPPWPAVAPLLVVLWAVPSAGQKPAGEVWLKADFGAIGDGTSDDTAAVHAFLAACETTACRMEPGSYRVTAAPQKMNYPINLEGAGIDTSEFIRDYDEVSGRGFLHFEGVAAGKGVLLGNFSVSSATGRSVDTPSLRCRRRTSPSATCASSTSNFPPMESIHGMPPSCSMARKRPRRRADRAPSTSTTASSSARRDILSF